MEARCRRCRWRPTGPRCRSKRPYPRSTELDELELAEACLAHTVGNAVVQPYQRSSLSGRRRPIDAGLGIVRDRRHPFERHPAQGGALMIKITNSIEAFEAMA